MTYKIYTKENCPFCQKAKELMTSKGLQFEEVRIGVDVGVQLLIDMAPEARSAPVIFVDGKYIGGYNELVEHINRPGNMLFG